MRRICVDASCLKNHVVEFRAVDMDSGEELFRRGPFHHSSNNVGEALAIVLALAWVQKEKIEEFLVFSDSFCAITWVRNRKFNTALEPRSDNKDTFEMIRIAESLLEGFPLSVIMAVQKWDSRRLGDIPADYGRKGYQKKSKIVTERKSKSK